MTPKIAHLALFCALIVATSSANLMHPAQSAYAVTSEYIVKKDGNYNIAVTLAGTEVIRVAQSDTSNDILKRVHDQISADVGSVGGTIHVESGTFNVHTQMVFTVPITLEMRRDTILLFDAQPVSDKGILKTQARTAISGGVFDCNKIIQTKPYIHGLIIGVGSEHSTVTGVEARNCSTSGNGFVVRANYTSIVNAWGHHNEGDGIYLRSCDYCSVEDSTFSYNGVNGIDASDQDGLMAGHTLIYNNVADWNHDGINLDSTYYANTTQNTLRYNWIGIAEYHSTADNLYNSMTSNTVKYSTQYGIFEQGDIGDGHASDYSTITGNIMIGNGHSNIVSTVSPHTTVSGNTASTCG